MEFVATVLREMFAGVVNLDQACCVQIEATASIPEGMGVVPPPLVHLVMGFVKYLPHI
jgi:hypothetical protein